MNCILMRRQLSLLTVVKEEKAEKWKSKKALKEESDDSDRSDSDEEEIWNDMGVVDEKAKGGKKTKRKVQPVDDDVVIVDQKRTKPAPSHKRGAKDGAECDEPPKRSKKTKKTKRAAPDPNDVRLLSSKRVKRESEE